MSTALSDIDPALGRLGAFARVTRNAPAQVQKLRESAIFHDGALTAKVKTLAALLWAVSSRCEPCIKFYARKARDAGATDAELGEMLAVAPAMGACVAEMWALKAYHATTETGASDDAACCQ
jgi:AhpD family alkylhydroperoxidase